MLRKSHGFFLLLCVVLFITATGLSAQTPDNVTVKVAIVDGGLNVKSVPKLSLLILKLGDNGSPDQNFTAQNLVTSFEGVATAKLPAGDYRIATVDGVDFDDKKFEWLQTFKVENGKPVNIELSNDNASITKLKAQSARRVTEEAELFKRLRDGVVTVEGETGSGTGFIVDDEAGLILTNQHVISKSNEIRIQFDKKTKVIAELLESDAERDVAVLRVNLKACKNCRALKIGLDKPNEPSVVEGEKVFAIGSPLEQDKILTSGIVSKLEKRAIISDININPGNSGGPLFNSLGEVIGLTTFSVQAQSGPGISGIVRIEEAFDLLAKAKTNEKTKVELSKDLLPTIPEEPFSVDSIKTRVDVAKFPQKLYNENIKNYEIKFFTPVYKFYLSEKDHLQAAKDRDKRNSKKGVTGTVDRYQNLRNWNEYAGELRPVVEVLALPETTASGKSMFLGAITAVASQGMIMTPFDYKFKADFYSMSLLCDDKEVTPLQRRKAELGAAMQSYYKTKQRYTYAGLYAYPHEIFEPGKCQKLELRIFSEEDPKAGIIRIVDLPTKQRIWDDFADYRKAKPEEPTIKP